MLLCHLVRHWLLGILPLPAPIDERDKEEGSPEDEVSHRDHKEHLHPHHPLLLHPRDVLLDVARGTNIAFLGSETLAHFLVASFTSGDCCMLIIVVKRPAILTLKRAGFENKLSHRNYLKLGPWNLERLNTLVVFFKRSMELMDYE